MPNIPSPLSGIFSIFGARSGTSRYAINFLDPGYVLALDRNYFRANKAATSFDNAITHSRTSNATMVDSDGVLKWAPHNLLLWSEEFDNASWVKGVFGTASAPVVTPNVAVAPDGTTTADLVQLRLNGATDTSFSWLYQNNVVGSGDTRTFSVFIKAATASDVGKAVRLTGTSVATVTLTADWQSVLVSALLGTGATISFGVRLRGIDGTADSADLLLWGAHLYRSDLGGMVDNPDRGDSYVPTTSSARYLARRGHHIWNGSAWVNEGLLHESEARTNLVTYSEDFTNAAWTKTAVNVTADDATAPDGNLSADLLNDTSTSGRIQTIVAVTAGATATFSVWLRRVNQDWARVQIFDGANGFRAWFNLATGVVGTSVAFGTGVLVAANIEESSGDWYRCAITGSIPATSNYTLWVTGADANASLNTVIGAQRHIYGAQLEAAPTPSSYIPTSGATVTRAADTLTVPSANLPWPTPRVIGPELVTNGTFDTDVSGWFASNATLSAASSNLLVTNTGSAYGFAYQGFPTIAGKTYKVLIDVVAVSPSFIIRVGDDITGSTNQKFQATGTSLGTQTTTFVATASTTYIRAGVFTTTSGNSATFDNISVREIDPLAVSIQMQGRMTYADEGVLPQYEFVRWYADASNYIRYMFDTQTGTGGPLFRQAASGVIDGVVQYSAYSPGINVPFNIASRHGSTFVNGAVDGTALTANTTPVALPDLSATDLNLGFDYMGTIKLFRIWAADLADAGIAEAST